ncbi:MAG: hypothetical protein ACRDJ9_29170, partial [Dehalococcoidia bacterium]
MSIEEAKAGVAAAGQSASQAISQLQGTKQTIEQAMSTLASATQGTSHSSVNQAIGHYQQAQSKIDEAVTMIGAAVQTGNQ